MDCDDQVLSTTVTFELVKQLQSFSLCQVCGTEKAQIHYGALCCASCKMFFRRNAKFDLNNNQCVFPTECDITINSRRACRYCRMKKCFSVGMQRELLRAKHHQQSTRMKQSTNEKILPQSVVIHPLDLLQNDRSLLTCEQWSYLSNVTNSYNTKSPVLHIRHLLEVQSTYPMKIRLKMAANNMLNIMGAMYETVLPFVENLSHFASLSVNDRSILIERNIKNVGGYSGIVMCRDADMYSSPTFKMGFPSIYGPMITDYAVGIFQRTDNDGSLIKLLLPILIFSTGADLILLTNENEMNKNVSTNKYRLFSNPKHILSIQNFYVEILFKYMIFRYGYQEASLRFAALIKSSLDQSMCAYRAAEIQKHEQLVQAIVEKNERSLTIQNETVIDSIHLTKKE